MGEVIGIDSAKEGADGTGRTLTDGNCGAQHGKVLPKNVH